MRRITIIVEEHSDGYVAYPVGLKGVIVAQGETYEQALADVGSAIAFHVETFGDEALKADETAPTSSDSQRMLELIDEWEKDPLTPGEDRVLAEFEEFQKKNPLRFGGVRDVSSEDA